MGRESETSHALTIHIDRQILAGCESRRLWSLCKFAVALLLAVVFALHVNFVGCALFVLIATYYVQQSNRWSFFRGIAAQRIAQGLKAYGPPDVVDQKPSANHCVGSLSGDDQCES